VAEEGTQRSGGGGGAWGGDGGLDGVVGREGRREERWDKDQGRLEDDVQLEGAQSGEASSDMEGASTKPCRGTGRWSRRESTGRGVDRNSQIVRKTRVRLAGTKGCTTLLASRACTCISTAKLGPLNSIPANGAVDFRFEAAR
jgi:hypothetical protein